MKRHLVHLHSPPGETFRRSELMDAPGLGIQTGRDGFPQGTRVVQQEKETRGDKYSTYLFYFCFTILKHESKHVQILLFVFKMWNVSVTSHMSDLPAPYSTVRDPGSFHRRLLSAPWSQTEWRGTFSSRCFNSLEFFFLLFNIYFTFTETFVGQIKIKD